MNALQPNTDESKVPAYTLPDPLIDIDGIRIDNHQDWITRRRPQILSLFEEHVYGKTPSASVAMSIAGTTLSPQALNGKAVRKEVSLRLKGKRNELYLDLLMYLPLGQEGPVPLFVGLNFHGNYTIHPDRELALTGKWVRNSERIGTTHNQASEGARGGFAQKWAVERILERGYGIATLYCGDLDPDYDDGFQNGVHPLFYGAGQTMPAANEWGTIGAWAWGLSRVMDYFELDDSVDQQRIAVMGHSRLGKTALWAGAQDQRFALVISNNSGCGGAALSRRRFGETVALINDRFPHWFCRNFRQYNENEQALPVDQHMLIALIAPRPVYIASAEQDLWCDPLGEFLALKHAGPVYRLLGTGGLEVAVKPPVGQPVLDTMAYHMRPGEHDVTAYDWERYLDFADYHFGHTTGKAMP
ncbi:MAG: acetylxylan esterase [Chloroflexi bacterium]|nr:acetylxylan esterase [Chloroflexota bacterium]